MTRQQAQAERACARRQVNRLRDDFMKADRLNEMMAWARLTGAETRLARADANLQDAYRKARMARESAF